MWYDQSDKSDGAADGGRCATKENCAERRDGACDGNPFTQTGGQFVAKRKRVQFAG